jgi:hypothetical protein
MRNLPSIIRFAASGLALWAVMGCSARQAQLRPQGPPILKTERPPVIDGVLDDPCWKEAAPIRVDYLHGKEGQEANEPRMIVRYAWDEHYLYIAYETFDRNLVARSLPEKHGPPGNQRDPAMFWDPNDSNAKIDVVEFFISFGDKQHFWELHHNAASNFSDIWVTTPDPSWPFYNSSMCELWGLCLLPEAYIKDEDSDTLATAVKLKPKADGKPSTINDAKDEDSGYTGEIRLPWYGIGAPIDWRKWYTREIHVPKQPGKGPGPWSFIAGHEVIILAVCQNGDYPGMSMYAHASPRRITSWFHKQVDDWPRYRLVAPARGK